MGVVLCSCTQQIIASKQKHDVELSPKISNPINVSNRASNLKTKFKENKEKHLTKDSTLVNYSNNNNSPDYHETNKVIPKTNLLEIEGHNNSNKNEIKNSKTNEIKENKNDIFKKVTFDKCINRRKKLINNKMNNHSNNNIHVINQNRSLDSSITKKRKIEKCFNINKTNESEEKNLMGFRADSFNFIENPIKNILTNKTNINTNNTTNLLMKSDPKKNFISNKTIDGMNKQEEKHLRLSFSIKTNGVFGKENQKLLWYYLHNHFMIMEYKEEFIKYLMDFMNIVKFKNKEIIFKKGEIANNFYIIKQGYVMLLSNGKSYKRLIPGNTFGEISLFQKEGIENNNDNNDSISVSVNNNDILLRNYTAMSYGNTELFVISKSSYNLALKAFSSKLKTIDYNEFPNDTKEHNKEIIENYKFFSYLDDSAKNLMLRMSKIFTIKNSGTLLSISNYSRIGLNSFLGSKPYFRSGQNLIFPIQGELVELSENLTYRKRIKKDAASGIIPALCPKIKNQLITKTNQEDTKFFYIPEEVLIEVLGPNYSREIMKQYFFYHFLEQQILSIFLNINLNNINNNINNLNENDKKKINEAFKAFSIKEYEQGEVIYFHKNTLENKKIIIPIVNNLLIYISDVKKKEIEEEKIILNEIFEDYDSDFNIRSESSWTIVLETKWKNIYDTFNTSKNYQDIVKRFNIYKDMISLRPLQSLTIQQLIDFGLEATIKEYQPKEIIIKNNEKSDIFYLIIKGRVKVKTPQKNKTVRVYEEGNCFGCYQILTELESSKNFISNDYTKCYCITKQKFYEFLKNPNFNDYIKKKMLLEDEEMQLSDFYYISYLGKGTFGYVCLVHNELAFYAIKAINREAAEKRKNGVNNIVNEKKCMIALDHPFIVNFVKTMKNNNWVFILEEYIKGKNFEDYLESRKSTKSMKELIFYGGCLFHMLKYLTKRRIMHRDIKPKNIMIDTGGYLKLLDFGCSRKIKFFTKTIVGTPNYISPEVLKGKEYSFTCDYWSVGVCCYFIYFGKLPFGEKTSNVMQIYKEIINKEITIPKDCPLAVKDLIENLLKKNIGERIHNFEEVKECQLFKDFDWDNLLRKKLRPFFIPTGEDLGGRVNLKNLASPFDKFIKNEWVETSEMHLLKIKNNINDEIQDQVGQNNDNDDLYAENKDEFSINWFDYF